MVKVTKTHVVDGRVEDEMVDVICDLCSNSCKILAGYAWEFKGSDKQVEVFNFEYATLSASWGYSSKHDFEYHECHICEECYEKLPFRSQIRVVDPFEQEEGETSIELSKSDIEGLLDSR